MAAAMAVRVCQIHLTLKHFAGPLHLVQEPGPPNDCILPKCTECTVQEIGVIVLHLNQRKLVIAL
jgi:hypothetical protein